MNGDNTKHLEKNSKKVDIWRDTKLRYLGYSNEIGEAFGTIYPKVVRPSYAIAFAYVGCDTVNKTLDAFDSGKPRSEILKVTLDTFTWQLFASVIIPGQFIHYITHGSKSLLSKEYFRKRISGSIIKWSPTLIGLATIPLIVHPIDNFVDFFMDQTIRKFI